MLRKEDYSSFVMKKNCAWQTHGVKKGAQKKTSSMSRNETEIDFVLVGRNNRQYLKDRKKTRNPSPKSCNIG